MAYTILEIVHMGGPNNLHFLFSTYWSWRRFLRKEFPKEEEE
jgi:hypothetical protein